MTAIILSILVLSIYQWRSAAGERQARATEPLARPLRPTPRRRPWRITRRRP